MTTWVRGRQGTAENGGKRRKTTEDGRGRQGMTEDAGGRRGMTKCRPSSSFALTCWANSEKDGMGRHNAVRPGPGPGRTDCPVENTDSNSEAPDHTNCIDVWSLGCVIYELLVGERSRSFNYSVTSLGNGPITPSRRRQNLVTKIHARDTTQGSPYRSGATEPCMVGGFYG